MTQTDSRAGFRLPWSTERGTAEAGLVGETGIESPTERVPADENSPTVEGGATTAHGEGEQVIETDASHDAPPGEPAETAPAATRKPSKFLADLTRAMQAAAEEARNATLSQFQADAKTHVEHIHERSATEAAALRRAADDDVAAVREWSKGEIARIREETESRISARKARLEGEIEGHAARIEEQIERVQGHVAAFEQEMAEFFERLLTEEEPTRFATMAERLPEPPSFEATALTGVDAPNGTGEEPAVSPSSAYPADAEASPPAGLSVDDPDDVEVDREAAFAAIQAAAEAADDAEVATDAGQAAAAGDIVGSYEQPDDRSFSSADLDAAEAEAAASADDSGNLEDIPVIADEALAARLANLLPVDPSTESTETQTTQVVVSGLVSVASIASFKRHLGRLAGVTSVGVSSGPDGEFLFAVQHASDCVLRDAIPSLPSFQARVTGSDEATLTVTATDPESDH